MSVFNFSTLIKILMKDFSLNQREAGDLILSGLIEESHTEVVIDRIDKEISNLANNKMNVMDAIKQVAQSNKGVQLVEKHLVEDRIIKERNWQIDCSVPDINALIQNDLNLDINIKNHFDKLSQEQNKIKFLASAFCLACTTDNLISEEDKDDDENYLLAEANGKCPNCGKNLIVNKNKKPLLRYKIWHIFPKSDDKDRIKQFAQIYSKPENINNIENKIILCLDCYNEFGQIYTDYTDKELTKLLDKKKSLQKNCTISTMMENTNLDEKIIEVVKALFNINNSTKLHPIKEPLQIKQKIEKENCVLCNDITDKVTKYFSTLKDWFKKIEESNDNSTFEKISTEIRLAYLNLKAKELSQNAIYDKLSDWILTHTKLNSDYKMPAQIIVAFFVQQCVVFDKIETKKRKNK